MDSMTDKTNNKNLEEREGKKKGLVQLEKSPTKIPTLGHPSSGGMMCQQRKVEDIDDPLKHFQQLLIHSQKKCSDEILSFCFSPFTDYDCRLPRKDQPLRCHSTSNAA
jgi:hypothetical protein